MKSIIIASVFSLALGLTALAQTTPGGTQASGTNPSPQPQTSPSQSPSMSDPGMSNGAQNTANDSRGEKKLKGCIKSEGGKYMLEEKHGKEIALTGSQDFASHVGHTVTVHGTWGSGGASATSSNSGIAGGGQFMVSKLDMVSESCRAEKGSKAQDDANSKPSPNHK